MFSFDQIGQYDLPAMIDTIQQVSGAEKIFYGGHSMGTTSFMVMSIKRPEYAEKVASAHFLAPIAYVDHMTSPLKYVAPFAGSIDVSLIKGVKKNSQNFFLKNSKKNRKKFHAKKNIIY